MAEVLNGLIESHPDHQVRQAVEKYFDYLLFEQQAFELQYEHGVVALAMKHDVKINPLMVDFVGPKMQFRTKTLSPKQELILKAVKCNKPGDKTVLDATAGLGVDAWLLAAAGYHVTMLERNPALSVLLLDGLYRARQTDIGSKVGSRVNIVCTDAYDYLTDLSETARPEVIHLDPMFPKRDKAAQVKAGMQILHELLGEIKDEPELVELAKQKVKQKVIVKRPKGAAELLAGKHSMIESKNHRYDVYTKVTSKCSDL